MKKEKPLNYIKNITSLQGSIMGSQSTECKDCESIGNIAQS